MCLNVACANIKQMGNLICTQYMTGHCRAQTVAALDLWMAGCLSLPLCLWLSKPWGLKLLLGIFADLLCILVYWRWNPGP